MKPFVKWAGGKRQILKKIKEFISESLKGREDDDSYTYIEPFLGGGAVFLDLKPKNAIVNDLNEDLINAYNVIKSEDYGLLIKKLEDYSTEYNEDKDGFYYDVRAMDRMEGWPESYSNIERAARMIFLNRTCYNGLFRVNSKGQFNTPIGRYSNPLICDKENIIELHEYFSSSEKCIEIMNESYEAAIRKAKDGDIIYIDPPYDYEDDDGFTKYQMAGFTFGDFKKLKKECDEAINKGAFVIISNNATTKVKALFEQDPKYKIYYDVNEFSTLRTINCNGEDRKSGREAIFWGIPNGIPFPQANDINKVISLLKSSEEEINDKDRAAEILGVSTHRQVAYYLSALLYLKYLTHEKKFTDKALKLNGNEILIKRDIYETLKLDKDFYVFYKLFYNTKSVNIDKINLKLQKNNKDLSESTIKRRASTIKRWVEWMFEIENEIFS